MLRDSFPGYPIYLEAAARQIGHPEAEAPARRITALSALANLCAQASMAAPEDAPAILDKASEFRDQLHAAAIAADLMIEEVASSFDIYDAASSQRRKSRPEGGSLPYPKAPASRRPRPS